MSGLAAWAIDAVVASTLLMLLVLLVRGPVRRAFGPGVAYALWLLPLVRIVLPPLPATGRAVAPAPLAHLSETIVLVVGPDAGAPAGGAGWPSLFAVLVVLWAVGAGAFLLYHVIGHARFCRRIRAAAVSSERVGGIEIVVSTAAPGPIAFGVRRRCVALPADMAERYDADERALALAHEIGHHRRGDLLANWAALGMLAVHWFDPLAWHAFRAFRSDQEMANDAAVLAGRSPAERRVYALAILKTAHGGTWSVACHLHTLADLKGRLSMLAISPASRRRLATGSAAVATLIGAGLALTASQSGAAAIRAEVAQVAAQPAPPAPPAPPAAPALAADGVPSSHTIRKVIVTKDGKTTVHEDYDSAAIDRGLAEGERISIAPPVPGGSRMIVKMPDDPAALVEVQDIPAVRSAKCGIGRGKPASMVVQNGRGPKRLIVICTDRIQKVSADAAAAAADSPGIERDAYAKALAGLLDARVKLAADTGISDTDRSRSLAAIDTSITEIRGQLARTH